MFAIDRVGRVTADFIFLSRGLTTVPAVWLICHIDIGIHGLPIRLADILTTVCHIITRVITAGISMLVSVVTGRAGIDIAGITGMAVIPITGMVRM